MTSKPREIFDREKEANIRAQGADKGVRKLALTFMRDTAKYQYSYNFSWMGVPVIQFPQDLLAIAEIIFRTKPDLIVEAGIAHGGGLVFYASLLELLGGDRRVVGIDIGLRDHNRAVLAAHPMKHRVELVDGSSTSPEVVAKVFEFAAHASNILVILDSNHTHSHVLRELKLYAPLVRTGGYLIVLDTTIEDQPDGFFRDKPWTKTDNPKTAVRAFLKSDKRFVIDHGMDDKLLISAAWEGYLRCVEDP